MTLQWYEESKQQTPSSEGWGTQIEYLTKILRVLNSVDVNTIIQISRYWMFPVETWDEKIGRYDKTPTQISLHSTYQYVGHVELGQRAQCSADLVGINCVFYSHTA